MGILRFIAFCTDPIARSLILLFYYLSIAVLLLLLELGIKKSRELFLFLCHFNGKAIFFILLGLTMFSPEVRIWLQYPIAIYFLVVGLLYAVFGWVFKEQESLRIRREILEPMEKENQI
jgi:hypothetical protein